MQNLKLKLTTNAPRNYRGRLTIQCSVPGTTTRHYMLVPGIESADYQNWNEGLQCFTGIDKTTLHDNGIIGDVMTRLNELLETHTFSSGKELFDAFRGVPQKLNKKMPTLGEFLDIVVAEDKGKEVGASSNYQLYFTLHNKLKGVNLKKRTTFTPAPPPSAKSSAKSASDSPANRGSSITVTTQLTLNHIQEALCQQARHSAFGIRKHLLLKNITQ